MTHHTKDKGDLATMKAMSDLTTKGYTVLAPVVSEHLPFDFIAYKENKYYRIQSKYSAHSNVVNKSIWNDKNGSHHKKYDLNDFDYYAIYIPQIDKVVYPSISFGGIKIRHTVPNSATQFYWWEDFINFTDEAQKKHYKDFGIELTHTPTIATEEAAFKRRKVVRPTKDELTELLWKQPTSQIAKQFGVSDKAVAKWAKSYNISKPPRGYWVKVQYNKV